MKIREVIERVDTVKPNAFPTFAKLEWISALEGRIAADVFLMAPVEIRQFRYVYPEDMETELLLEPPHDDIYLLWLQAKIDEENGEYNKYENSMAIYNEHYANFLRWFCQLYDPVQGYKSEERRRFAFRARERYGRHDHEEDPNGAQRSGSVWERTIGGM